MTIVSRGNFGGYAQRADEDRPQLTRQDMIWEIRTALAGRAAELVFFGKETGTTTGISGDLRQATRAALGMLSTYAMEDHAMLSLDMDKLAGSSWGSKILEQAEQILEQEMAKTVELIEQGRDLVEKLAQQLLAQNQLTGPQIDAVFGK